MSTNHPTAAQPIDLEPVARVDRIISASGLAEVSVFLESALKVGTVLYAAAAHAAAAPSAEQATPLTDLWMHDDMDRDAAAGAINAPRKDLKAAHKKAVDDVIYWRRRALSAEVSVGTATNTEQPPSGNTGEVAASIDTPEFRVMMNVYRTGSGLKADERFHNIVAHIDAQLARQRQAAPVAWLDRDGRMKDELRSFIEGMSVSMDVSTGDHDAGNRYFGIINEVMDDNNDKNGVTLLVYDAQPNFAAPVPQGAEQAATAAVTNAVQGETAAQVGAGDLPPYEVVAAVNSLRWMLNKSDECDKPNMRATTLLDKHHSKDGKTIRQDLEILWRYFDANRPEMTALLLSGADRAAAPAVTDAARDVLADAKGGA